ncbi:hypothetical protein Gobs01_02618 [Geodermatophilus obscurus DSM 43160]|uniref:Uncharacterized protein n=1 Tax=Geodermatophilus obscurus (strain ATCC 25078 / DSM 43160 / JCM 3152 / CCUG 61914 / KCC A-0152 / KCTC 9177 / NBRC 13315 / NRRL B-3577 / G-20) TaxID=526225 RepID=D2S535_GEOOG|nr:hypothetical protein Gobs_0350 [Geodermatophilus obscurus DSM 43160]
MDRCWLTDRVDDVFVRRWSAAPRRVETPRQVGGAIAPGRVRETRQIGADQQLRGLPEREGPTQPPGSAFQDPSALLAGHRQHEVRLVRHPRQEGLGTEVVGADAVPGHRSCRLRGHRPTGCRGQSGAGDLDVGPPGLLTERIASPGPDEALRHGRAALVARADEEKAHAATLGRPGRGAHDGFRGRCTGHPVTGEQPPTRPSAPVASRRPAVRSSAGTGRRMSSTGRRVEPHGYRPDAAPPSRPGPTCPCPISTTRPRRTAVPDSIPHRAAQQPGGQDTCGHGHGLRCRCAHARSDHGRVCSDAAHRSGWHHGVARGELGPDTTWSSRRGDVAEPTKALTGAGLPVSEVDGELDARTGPRR